MSSYIGGWNFYDTINNTIYYNASVLLPSGNTISNFTYFHLLKYNANSSFGGYGYVFSN